MKSEFETDETGDVITKPLLGWTIAPVAGTAVLLAARYADNPEELETMTGKTVQLILTPQQCLELSAVLTRLANKILDERLAPGKSPN